LKKQKTTAQGCNMQPPTTNHQHNTPNKLLEQKQIYVVLL